MHILGFIHEVWEYKKLLAENGNRHHIDDPQKGEPTQILDVCMGLHMSNTGSSDRLPKEKAAKYCGWLMMRLESWHYTSDKYDEIVRQLVKHTIEETINNN